jgi:hypothetical protein
MALAIVSCGSSSTAPPTPPPQQPPVVAAPPASAGHALVYHNQLRAVLLVNAGLGGMSSPPSTARTVLWKWNGQSWTAIDSSGPPIRNLGGVAYDSHRDRLVLYGGSYSVDLVYDETWEWSQTSGWTRLPVTGPGRRDHTDMVYDAERRRVVLFGGQSLPGTLSSGTWTWDGTTWEQFSSGPVSSRIHHAMAYDASSRRTLLFGGVAAGGTVGDTWAWNGTTWESAAGASTPRSHARIAMSADGMLLVGGFASDGGPVARLVSGTWSLTTGTDPGPRYLPALAFDPDRGVTVLNGGGDPASDRLLGDTWEYSSANGWRRIAP